MISYRLAEAADVGLIHRLLCQMTEAEGAELGSTPERLLQHGFGATPRFRAVLAEAEAPLGLCLFLPEYSTWRGALGIFIQDLYLTPEARGKGAGRGLLAAAWASAQDWQPEFIALMVKRSNHAAIGFYQSLGFDLRDASDPFILTGAGLTALSEA
jgi:ribosomal protein S18 acetylase RimI-like enzyme